MKEKKYRFFTLVLYKDENEEHKKIFNYITLNYNYCYILHDKDKDLNGNIKKAHYHVVFKVENGRTIKSIIEELNVQYIEPVRSKIGIKNYLTHENDPDKYHYSATEVKGSLEIFDEDDQKESNAIFKILDFIDSIDGIILISELNRFCSINQLWSYYRRSSNIIIQTLKEHNNKYYR